SSPGSIPTKPWLIFTTVPEPTALYGSDWLQSTPWSMRAYLAFFPIGLTLVANLCLLGHLLNQRRSPRDRRDLSPRRGQLGVIRHRLRRRPRRSRGRQNRHRSRLGPLRARGALLCPPRGIQSSSRRPGRRGGPLKVALLLLVTVNRGVLDEPVPVDRAVLARRVSHQRLPSFHL